MEVSQPQQQKKPQQVNALPIRTSCKICGGPIIYERNQCAMIWLIVCCCASFTLCFLPEREAECAACGAKQGYSIPNTHSSCF